MRTKNLAWILLLGGLLWLSSPLSAGVVQMGAHSPVPLQQMLDELAAGDTLILQAGVYSGNFVIRNPIALVGTGEAVLDGQGQGTVLTIQAPGVLVKNLVIRNSGINLSNEDAGISIEAPGARILQNKLEKVLFGIYLKQAHGSHILNNQIMGHPEMDIPRRGDLVRCWYSDSLLIENNVLAYGRDLIVWFSHGSLIRGNDIRNARYGIHLMYSTDCTIRENILLHNSVGTYLMYSKRIRLWKNTIAYNRTASGIGIGLKDLDDCWIEENLVVDNRMGIFVDNSPRDVRSFMHYLGNVLAYNDAGISLLSFVTRSNIHENSFVDNYEQVALSGSGNLKGNVWEGNYWSDYYGFDENGDGVGDVPYRSEKLFEDLILRNERLRFFAYSPVIQAINFAARAFPVVRPQPKIEDPRPLIRPFIPQGLPLPTDPGQARSKMPYLVAIVLGVFIIFSTTWRNLKPGKLMTAGRRKNKHEEKPMKSIPRASHAKQAFTIQIQNLVKTFGKVRALDGVSFTVQEGEAVALWGSNGAGKTTVLRCILGLLPYEGKIQVNGFDMERQGKQARFFIGFVPQDVRFHDNFTVQETMRFYAQLKKVPQETIQTWLQKVGLWESKEKEVKALSGGMRQKLALAIALLSNPPILLLDEPTANLDIHSREEFLSLLQGLKEEKRTIVYSSHRLEEVIPFADRVLILDQGRLVADAPPFEVHQHLSQRGILRLTLPREAVEKALRILRSSGLKAKSNGKGIKVFMEGDQKIRPLELLIRSGIEVLDFDYVFQN